MKRIFDKNRVRQGAGGKVSALIPGISLAALVVSGVLSLIVVSAI